MNLNNYQVKKRILIGENGDNLLYTNNGLSQYHKYPPPPRLRDGAGCENKKGAPIKNLCRRTFTMFISKI
jgi:hypothetical protein